jgi:hypothetical protein
MIEMAPLWRGGGDHHLSGGFPSRSSPVFAKIKRPQPRGMLGPFPGGAGSADTNLKRRRRAMVPEKILRNGPPEMSETGEQNHEMAF